MIKRFDIFCGKYQNHLTTSAVLVAQERKSSLSLTLLYLILNFGLVQQQMLLL